MTTNVIPRFEVQMDGNRNYVGEIAKISDFHLGREDHGIFTAIVGFEGAAWGQGISPVCLGYASEKEGSFTAEYLIKLIDAIGSPEEAKGRRVVVFRAKDGPSKGWYDQIEGFALLNSDGTYGEPFFYSEIYKKYFPENRKVG